MKIYTITNEYENMGRVGGIGMYIAGLKEVLGAQLIVETVDVFPLRISLIRRLWRATEWGDQIWVHHVFPVGFATYLLSFLGRSYTLFFHGNDFDTARMHVIRRCILRFILRRARHVVANSHTLAEDIERAYGVKVRVLHPWLPQDAESCLLDSALRGKKTTNKVILTIGRFVPRKGFDLLLNVAEKLPHYQFIFAGPENMYARQLKHRAQQHGLINLQFIYNPTRQDLLTLYQEACYFAMPTIKHRGDREGFGIVYLEAQAAGLPVIAVGHREVREAIAPILQPYLADDASVDEVIQVLKDMEDANIFSDYNKTAKLLKDFVRAHHTLDSRRVFIREIAQLPNISSL